jgi:hypothetical protein
VALAGGDFNGDGKTDLVVASYTSNSVQILRGSGTGTFEVGSSYPVGSTPVMWWQRT